MIKINNLSFKYKDEIILKQLSFSLPHYGLISICGPSGCGKTTLMNCIAGLLNYQGEIIIDGCYLNRYTENEMNLYRLKNIGLVFQDFKLFECETVENNIMFPLNILGDYKSDIKRRKANDLLELVGMENKSKRNLRDLSGGEKQRTAIARALANDPKIILADEPTGSLDSKNSIQIMEILSTIAKNHLVIIVSHDERLVEKYADQIIYLKDGEIERTIFNEQKERKAYLPICKTQRFFSKSKLPLKFLINHSKNKQKQQKWRTIFCDLVNSLSLIGIGLAISISSIISSNINNMYSSIIDEDKIIITTEKKSISQNIEAKTYDEVSFLAAKHSEDIKGIGCCYYCDFESIFVDTNEIVIPSGGYQYSIEGINGRHINEFIWLEENELPIYPNEISELNDDEVILTLNMKMVEDICFALKIKRTVNSLSDFLINNHVNFYFNFSNSSWGYFDQQLLTLKGFCLDTRPSIIHSNHFWNEYMFEERMKLPYTFNFNDLNIRPWTLRKTYYLVPKNNAYDCLKNIMTNEYGDSFLFEIANRNFYPYLYKDIEQEKRNRILILENKKNQIPFRYCELIKSFDSSIINPVIGTSGSYSIFPDYMMMGFSKPVYFSNSEEHIETVVDLLSHAPADSVNSIELNTNILCGHYSKTLQNGVIFHDLQGFSVKGRIPNSCDEIVVSSQFAEQIYGDNNPLNQTLDCAFCISEILMEDDFIKREFIAKELKIVGVIESPNLVIYQEPFWLYGYFEYCLGISAFELQINSLSLSLKDGSNIDRLMNKIKRAFPSFDISSPSQEITGSVASVCGYAELILIVFSLTSVVVSIFLLGICNFLHLNEITRDISLARCIGVNRKESTKFVQIHSLYICFKSFMLSSAELLFISLLTSIDVSNNTAFSIKFEINPLSLIVMFVISLIISLISSAFASKKVKKINPLEGLKM